MTLISILLVSLKFARYIYKKPSSSLDVNTYLTLMQKNNMGIVDNDMRMKSDCVSKNPTCLHTNLNSYYCPSL